jgi:hypothetical protein
MGQLVPPLRRGLRELETALRDPPTLSSLTGVPAAHLSSLALAAPALLQAFTAGTSVGGSGRTVSWVEKL